MAGEETSTTSGQATLGVGGPLGGEAAAQQSPSAAMAAVQTLRRSPAPPALAPSASYDDADLDAAALKLDEHSRLLRADMLAQLLDCKRKLGERQQAAAAAAAAQGASQLAAKQQQVDAASAELARQREIVRRTGTVLFKAARWRRQLSLGCRSWRAWRAYVRRWAGSSRRLHHLLYLACCAKVFLQ